MHEEGRKAQQHEDNEYGLKLDEDEEEEEDDDNEGKGEASEEDPSKGEEESDYEEKRGGAAGRRQVKREIAPKAGKGARNMALYEEVKRRDLERQREAGGTKGKILQGAHKVDRDCKLPNVSVLDDYSCQLQQDDVSYNEDTHHTWYHVLQLLQRDDGLKWWLWTKKGKLA
jgi:hypothetical protein